MSNDDKFKISEMFLDKIKENGYTVCGVFDNTGKEPNFVYTISATTDYNAEFIFVGKGSINMLHGILINILSKGIVTEGQYQLEDFKIKIDGELQNARIELIDVTGSEWLDDTILNRCDDFNKVYQVLFADISNGLPTDSGNTDSFCQLHFHKPKLMC